MEGDPWRRLRGGSEQSGIEGPYIQKEGEGASISGGGFPSIHTVHKRCGRVGMLVGLEGMVWAGLGWVRVCGAAAWRWSLAGVLRCFLLHSWKLNGLAAAEESLPLGARVTTVPHGKGDLMGQGDVGWQPCCCLVCLSVKKWLNVAVHLLDITKAINKWYQAFLSHMARTGQGNV